MKGIELSEAYYLEYGEPMLREQFPHIMNLIAVGIAGSGSECFGYDDKISEDHDFEAGFCIFIPGEDKLDRKTEFALERAYSKLPKDFMGYRRERVSPVGGNRRGVIRAEEFFLDKTGSTDGTPTLQEWLLLPEQALLEATSGKVFYDGLGEFSAARKRLEYMPEDIRLKKLAGELLMMGQSGQYNYERCVARGESGAAQLALYEFVKSAMHAVFLLNRSYMPYYKWSFRALRALPTLSYLSNAFELLISTDNGEANLSGKKAMIEKVCEDISKEVDSQALARAEGNNMEALAYAVNSKISNEKVRNLHILYAV